MASEDNVEFNILLKKAQIAKELVNTHREFINYFRDLKETITKGAIICEKVSEQIGDKQLKKQLFEISQSFKVLSETLPDPSSLKLVEGPILTLSDENIALLSDKEKTTISRILSLNIEQVVPGIQIPYSLLDKNLMGKLLDKEALKRYIQIVQDSADIIQSSEVLVQTLYDNKSDLFQNGMSEKWYSENLDIGETINLNPKLYSAFKKISENYKTRAQIETDQGASDLKGLLSQPMQALMRPEMFATKISRLGNKLFGTENFFNKGITKAKTVSAIANHLSMDDEWQNKIDVVQKQINRISNKPDRERLNKIIKTLTSQIYNLNLAIKNEDIGKFKQITSTYKNTIVQLQKQRTSIKDNMSTFEKMRYKLTGTKGYQAAASLLNKILSNKPVATKNTSNTPDTFSRTYAHHEDTLRQFEEIRISGTNSRAITDRLAKTKNGMKPSQGGLLAKGIDDLREVSDKRPSHLDHENTDNPELLSPAKPDGSTQQIDDDQQDMENDAPSVNRPS